jgi:hypothetical protein
MDCTERLIVYVGFCSLLWYGRTVRTHWILSRKHRKLKPPSVCIVPQYVDKQCKQEYRSYSVCSDKSHGLT